MEEDPVVEVEDIEEKPVVDDKLLQTRSPSPPDLEVASPPVVASPEVVSSWKSDIGPTPSPKGTPAASKKS